MSHVVIIVQQKIMPPSEAEALALTSTIAHEHGEMSAEVRYVPADSETPSQISAQVERIVKRLARLADSDQHKSLGENP